MWQRLGWRLVMRLMVLTLVIGVGMREFSAQKIHAPVTDQVSHTLAKEVIYSTATGLLPDVERRLDLHLAALDRSLDGGNWRRLHEEWLSLVRQWFARLRPAPEEYNSYVTAWLDRREKTSQWRTRCRRESYPDYSDDELFAKADWLRGQDEWIEMQRRIQKGLARIDAEYDLALAQRLGEDASAFQKLHQLFLHEEWPRGEIPPVDFFL